MLQEYLSNDSPYCAWRLRFKVQAEKGHHVKSTRYATLKRVGISSAALLTGLVGVVTVGTLTSLPSAAASAPLMVTGISIKSGATVNPNAKLVITFNQAIESNVTPSTTSSTSTSSTPSTTSLLPSYVSGNPVIRPSVKGGTWVQTASRVLTFESTFGFVSGNTYTVTIPSGVNGPRSTSGVGLATAQTIRFKIGVGSTAALNRDLSQLRYEPLTFSPSPSSLQVGGLGGAVRGSWSWRFKLPKQLTSQWNPAAYTVITKGAVMALENVNAITTDGVAGAAVWHIVTADLQSNSVDRSPWNYVLVRQASPQQLHLYVNGKVVYSTLVNTGIAASPTDIGTFPVYLRFTTTTMSGTNPDGSHYNDTGIPWVSYFSGGDALHGFLRSSYGWAQSLGCVEMPYANAGIVWPHTPIGTLVTVQPY